jgi:hypothetical protein
MFSILSHKRNANQKYTEIPTHHCQNGNHQENNNKCQQGCGKKEPSTLMVKMFTSATTMESFMENPQKTKTRTATQSSYIIYGTVYEGTEVNIQ